MSRRNQDLKHEKTLVFLPGWGFRASIWLHAAKQLTEYPFIVTDLPATDLPPLTHRRALTDIVSRIDQQIPDHSILVAWSMSGIMAASLCRLYPGKYAKLILVASTPRFSAGRDWPGISQDSLSRFQSDAKSDLASTLRRFHRMVGTHGPHPEIKKIMQPHCIRSSDKQILLYYLKMLAMSDARAALHHCSIPVLHLFGSHDPLISRTCADKIRIEYPHHDTAMITGAGHAPFISHTSDFNRHLRLFLKREH
ncbi:Pimeloyl-[acyl-carrier protein] methyl ester esterase [Aquicella siphonis]|uniref:Pimeloyl-[acyl-carrier protein] methyl ester esterase n=1 Tax=Aquicella siphonis TaxID=254247 RepID=A0A5E4PKR4_9COXI|nr:alpha/beta fold hydrolase [Aquicella siphonis]VVC76796.1 Pimeloyl-[acyl-carrier protein] methyl ester esterase [Aquicella siphonis]